MITKIDDCKIERQTNTKTFVAQVQRRGENIHSHNVLSIRQMWRDKEFLSLTCGKQEWESSPSILVTRNPNRSQRSGTRAGCVKKGY